MNLEKAINQLGTQGKTITALAKDLSLDDARWKPGPEDWSVLEVLNHLLDEEQLDFRRHLDHILFTPKEPWPAIAPQDWVVDKKYNQRSLDKTLVDFKSQRKKSISWLIGLDHPDWDKKVRLPWGDLSAGDMLASWLAHDLLHIRQLTELRYHLTLSHNLPYRVEYAGKW
mgnify:CR=1 FL=1